MTRKYRYKLLSVALGLLTVGATFTSCNPENDLIVAPSAGTGCLEVSYRITESRAAAVNPLYEEILKESTLRIYNANNQLIQKFTPATAVPAQLYLAAGSYRATLTAGTTHTATFSPVERLFQGEERFTIEAEKSAQIELACTLQNSVVKVVYHSSIAQKLAEGYTTHVMALDNYDAEREDTSIALNFPNDSVGYFILPEGVNNLSWHFEGFYPEDGLSISQQGTILNPQPMSCYTLNFQYSKTPDGYLDLTVSVDTTAQEHDDSFIFSPQPTIEGVGFDLAQPVNYLDEPIAIAISSIKELSSVELRTDRGERVLQPLVDGNPVDLTAQGVEYTAVDERNGVVTLSSDFFNQYPCGGVKELAIVATDKALSRGEGVAQLSVTGVLEQAQLDTWSRCATFTARVTNPTATTVELAYRVAGESDWTTLDTQRDGANYSASLAPTWNSLANEAGHTVYQPTGGIAPNKNYEVQLTVDGKAYAPYSYATVAGQSIPDANMENAALSCFTSSNKNSLTWASGNNSMAASLCKQSTYAGMGGSHCALLAGSDVILVQIAAGNLFLGQFEQSGTSGTVSFGQPFAWESRPTSLKLKYASSLGTVDAKYHDGAPLNKGDKDISSLLFAIVDWKQRHPVMAGTSAPTGVWSPDKDQEIEGAGRVIGYAVYHITESTSGDMEQLELPIYYYDTTTKPSEEITIVLSCATSLYGDYMTGSTQSKLYVDDFEFGY